MVIELPASLAEFGFPRFDSAAETGMISRWLLHANASVSSTHTGSPVSVRWKGSAVSSVIRRRASSPSLNVVGRTWAGTTARHGGGGACFAGARGAILKFEFGGGTTCPWG